MITNSKFDPDHALNYWLALMATLATNEAARGRSIHGPFHSYHEGYAVLSEEVDELWEEIKRKDACHNAIAEEAVQVAAMALRIAMIARRNSRS